METVLQTAIPAIDPAVLDIFRVDSGVDCLGQSDGDEKEERSSDGKHPELEDGGFDSVEQGQPQAVDEDFDGDDETAVWNRGQG